MGEHRCLPGVMARCPHGDRPVCTYEEGSQCEKDHLAYLPPTIREEWESYKATGLEPEEIRRMQEYMKPFTIQDMDRFREIMDAEKDRRLVVLPCRAGDTVYYIEGPCGYRRFYRLGAYTVSSIITRETGISVMACEITEPGMCLCHGEDFGKRAFINKDDAMKRLAELNKSIRILNEWETKHG